MTDTTPIKPIRTGRGHIAGSRGRDNPVPESSLTLAGDFQTKPKGRLTVDDIRAPVLGLDHATGAPVTTAKGKTGAVVWGRQRSRSTGATGSPAERARDTWHEAHRDEIVRFWKVYTSARGRGLPRSLGRGRDVTQLPDWPFTPQTTVDDFFGWLIDTYGHEEVEVLNMVDMPPKFSIPVKELGVFTGQLWSWRKWCRFNVNPAIVLSMSAEALDASGEAATDFYDMVLDCMASAELLPGIAEKLGVGAMELTKFIRAYQKTNPQARIEFNAALDLGLEWLTTRTHEEMAKLSNTDSDNLYRYNTLQQRLQNHRALVTKMAGSAYAAPAVQKNTVNINAGSGGMRIDFTTGRGADEDDVIDVLAYAPQESK